MRLSVHWFWTIALVTYPFALAFFVPVAICRGTVKKPGLLTAAPCFLPQRVETTALCSTARGTNDDDEIDNSSSLSGEELQVVKDLWTRSSDSRSGAGDDEAQSLEHLITQVLPTLHPTLVLKLQKPDMISIGDKVVSAVAKALKSVLDSRLAAGREILSSLLDCGEIRKLDAAIGQAARQGQLDMAFFTVLNMNMQDAQQKQQEQPEEQPAASESNKDESSNTDANRLQILQHIYTRCQEEVEKTAPLGIALLNKLLRTEVASIRKNQLEHYLCPQKNIITAPDGKEIQLEGTQQILVPPTQLVDAMAQSVKQIRTVESAGGISKASAASMVESCRQLAKEARIVIGESYGVESDVLRTFEEGLQPVFRPSAPDSPYIKGE